MEIYPDFRVFVAYANARDVRYLIVGGYAVGLHGHPLIGLDDLRANKRATGRTQDLADAEALEEQASGEE